jgi:hypothetical protein
MAALAFLSSSSNFLASAADAALAALSECTDKTVPSAPTKRPSEQPPVAPRQQQWENIGGTCEYTGRDSKAETKLAY